MDTCTKVLLFCIIVVIAFVSITRYKEHFMTDNKPPEIESCWDFITKEYKWNLNNYSENQKKVLLTFRMLKANTPEDDNRYFPKWRSCVIPKEHLPIYNRDINSKADWDLYNDRPDPNSLGYMRYTKVSENPDGYVINLTKHNESTFQQFLERLYLIYDKEYFDELAYLKEQIIIWKEHKRQKEEALREIQRQVAQKQREFDAMPSSECIQNKARSETLAAEKAAGEAAYAAAVAANAAAAKDKEALPGGSYSFMRVAG